MICAECNKNGLKSKVYPGVGYTTAAYSPPFYDEDGRYHNHDVNITTAEYSCSNGHRWTASSRCECWCGWDKETTDNTSKVGQKLFNDTIT